jgi:MFS family permease
MNSSKLKVATFLSEFACIAPVATLYFLDLGITLGQVVMAQVFYSLGALIAEIPTGVFADTFGRRLSIIIGHGISLLCVLGFLIVPGAGFLYTINLFQGVAAGFLSGSTEALLFESERSNASGPNEFLPSIASLISYGTLGFVLAAALSTLLVSHFGASAYFWLIVITAAAQTGSFLISFGLREYRVVTSPRNLSKAMYESITTLKSGMGEVYGSYVVFYIAIAAVITNCGEYFLREMFQPLFARVSIPSSYFGLVLCAGAILNFFIVRNSFKVERYSTLPKFLFTLYALISVGYFVLSTSSNHIVLIATAVILFGLFNAEKPLVSEYVNTHLPDSVRATSLSIVSLAAALGTILSRISLSFVLDSSGVVAGFLAQGTLLLLGASVAFLAMLRCNCVRRVIECPIGSI